MRDVEIILLRETTRQSLIRDAGTAASFIALISFGVLLDSGAMQWVGAIFGFLFVITRGFRVAKDSRMTIPEARAKLDEIEAKANE